MKYCNDTSSCRMKKCTTRSSTISETYTYMLYISALHLMKFTTLKYSWSITKLSEVHYLKYCNLPMLKLWTFIWAVLLYFICSVKSSVLHLVNVVKHLDPVVCTKIILQKMSRVSDITCTTRPTIVSVSSIFHYNIKNSNPWVNLRFWTRIHLNSVY